MFVSMRKHMAQGAIPKVFAGSPIAFVTSGLLSMAFMEFAEITINSHIKRTLVHRLNKRTAIMIATTAMMFLISICFGTCLSIASKLFHVDTSPIVDDLE